MAVWNVPVGNRGKWIDATRPAASRPAPKPSRRDWLRAGGRLLAASAVSTPALLSGCRVKPPSAEPIKVGVLHSRTGTMGISEASLIAAELMAIEEINAAGGVLGRPVEPVVEDGRSRFTDVFPTLARKLLTEDRVTAVFGCWASSSRKAVVPVFEELNGLLFYPVQYEGNESSRNVVYTGAAPNQQILPAVDWLLGPPGGSRKRFYLLGSDYVFPRTANYIITRYLQSKSVPAVGEAYVPLGEREFKAAVGAAIKANPDVIVSTINGDSNVGFYNELAAQGITAEKLPVVATSVAEAELRRLLPARVQGHLAAWTYFQSLNTPRNRHFVARFKEEFGWDRVTSDPIEAAYTQVYLWKTAVEKAGSADPGKVLDALHAGIGYDAPGGPALVDPKTHHTYKRFRMGRIRNDRQFDILYESPDWIAPDPYPPVAFPGWSCDWTKGGVVRGADVIIAS